MSRIHQMRVRALGALLAVCLLAPAGSAFAQDAGPVVDMQGVKFVPDEIHVAPGATVTWTNGSPLAHTVTADDASFDSGNLGPGEVFSMTFDAPGTYTYFCAPHKSIGMVGVVVVEDAAAAAASAATDAANAAADAANAAAEAAAAADAAAAAAAAAEEAPAPAQAPGVTPRPRDPNDYTPDH